MERQAVIKLEREKEVDKEIDQLKSQIKAERRDVEGLITQVEFLQAEACKFNNTIASKDRQNRKDQDEIRQLRNKVKRLEGR